MACTEEDSPPSKPPAPVQSEQSAVPAEGVDSSDSGAVTAAAAAEPFATAAEPDAEAADPADAVEPADMLSDAEKQEIQLQADQEKSYTPPNDPEAPQTNDAGMPTSGLTKTRAFCACTSASCASQAATRIHDCTANHHLLTLKTSTTTRLAGSFPVLSACLLTGMLVSVALSIGKVVSELAALVW